MAPRSRFLLLALLASPPLLVQPLLATPPARGGMQEPPAQDGASDAPPAGSIDAEEAAAIVRVLEDLVAEGTLPGAVALVAHRGALVVDAAVGRLTPGEEGPMRRDAIFDLEAMSQPITAAAALVLVDRGRASIDERVAEHLPVLGEMEVARVETGEDGAPRIAREPQARPLTLRDLLRQTAGLAYGEFGTTPVHQIWRERNPFAWDRPLSKCLEAFADLPLFAQPGTRWDYGPSYDVAGAWIEARTGAPLDVWVRKRVLQPLGMADTDFYVREEDANRLVPVVRVDGGGAFTPNPLRPIDVGHRPRLLSGGRGLFSTAPDYLRFLRMLASGGELDGVRVLSAKSAEALLSDQLGELPRGWLGEDGYGFGLAVRPPGARGKVPVPAGAAFGWGAGGTSFWIDRERDVVGVVFTPTWMRWDARGPFLEAVYAALAD